MQKKSSFRKILGNIWYFIWEDDSVLSWLVNIVIAFILIKYLVYPGLGFFLNTTHPVVAVVSGSMEHKTSFNNGFYSLCGKTFNESKKVDFDFFWLTCGDFYRQYNINKIQFEAFPFKNGFNTGDIMVLIGTKPENIKIGDIIVFKANQPDPIIHRVIKKWQDNDKYYFMTKGDHNANSLKMETSITEERIIGKAVFKIPFFGYVKIWFVEFLKLIGLNNSIGRLFR